MCSWTGAGVITENSCGYKHNVEIRCGFSLLSVVVHRTDFPLHLSPLRHMEIKVNN